MRATRPPRHHLSRRTRSVALGTVAAGLVPWIAVLWHQIPHHGGSRRLRNFWVALDGAEALTFASAGLLHLRRSPRQLPVLSLAAALLVTDAAVDLALADSPAQRRAAVSLLPVELAGVVWCLRIRRFAEFELAGYDTEKECRRHREVRAARARG